MKTKPKGEAQRREDAEVGTKITVSQQQLFLLAEHCARTIHSAVISMHVRLVTPEREHYNHLESDLRDIRALIRSLPGEGYCSARREFVVTVRYLFKQLRKESGTEAKWQDYIANVRNYHPEHITPECEAKLRLQAA